MKNGLLCFAVALFCVLAAPATQAQPVDGSIFSLDEFLLSLLELFEVLPQAEAAPASNFAAPEHAPFLPPGGAPDEESQSTAPPDTSLSGETLEHAPFWPPGG